MSARDATRAGAIVVLAALFLLQGFPVFPGGGAAIVAVSGLGLVGGLIERTRRVSE